LLDELRVDVVTLRLAVRGVRSADTLALVPGDAEPIEAVEQLLVALFAVAGGIRVFDAEDQLAAGVPRVRAVEQRGADEAGVRSSGGRRAEPHANGGTGCGGEGGRHCFNSRAGTHRRGGAPQETCPATSAMPAIAAHDSTPTTIER